VTWMKLDDRILEHPKFIRAVRLGGSEALHLWLGMRAWCAQALSDGAIPEDMIDEVRGPRRGRDKALAALVTVGLVERTDTGWTLHDYADWADSREEVLAARKKAADRQKASRQRRSGESQGAERSESRCMSRRDIAVTDGVSHGSVTPSVTLPPRARTETDTETDTETTPLCPPVDSQPKDLTGGARAADSGRAGIPCPSDLRLEPKDLASLEVTPGIPVPVAEAMAADLVGRWALDTERRYPSEIRWRQALRSALLTDWSDQAKRRRALDMVKPTEPGPEPERTDGLGDVAEWS